MRIIKTSSGSKLVMSKSDIDSLVERITVQAGYLPSIHPSKFFTWMNRMGYRKDRQVGSHQTWIKDSLPDGDPKKKVTIVFHGPEKEMSQGDLKRILNDVGVDPELVRRKGLPKSI